ncbi:hypothetical protein Cni_G13448 [Canna indica]|uniref:Uncharacterized protein n=1 Tax=Canna indica TaxID=4628 RepID=A0AAQ3QCQ0_9LILI|nr:hypothetical protein Cni_G13448 [Canna indica]
MNNTHLHCLTHSLNPKYIIGDEFGSFENVDILEVANLSLDEPEMETILFTDSGGGDKEKDDDTYCDDIDDVVVIRSSQYTIY